MKKLSILTCTILALSSFMAITVRADSPHFLKGSASLDSSLDYCVSFKEAGLGSTAVTYEITAGTGSTYTYQCFTKSGNKPQGEPNSISASGQAVTQTLVPRNGQITATLCLVPQQDGASCQGAGLVLKLIAVEYHNVTFSDITNGVDLASTSTPDLCSGGCP